MPNTNCLADIKCPQCGNEDNFRIEAVIVCHVTDEGSEPVGDHFWDKDSFCHCPECELDGKLSDFFVAEEAPKTTSRPDPQPIVIEVRGGVVVEVRNLPP